jgi:hypothetical protein
MGRPYDPVFSWKSDRLYCSELVAKVLVGAKIPPLPMQFKGSYWTAYFRKIGLSEPPRGVGVSPDHLYATLLKALK